MGGKSRNAKKGRRDIAFLSARLHWESSTGADRWSKSRGLANNRDEPRRLPGQKKNNEEKLDQWKLSLSLENAFEREREGLIWNLTEEWHADRRKMAGDDFAFEWTETRRKWLGEGEESSLLESRRRRRADSKLWGCIYPGLTCDRPSWTFRDTGVFSFEVESPLEAEWKSERAQLSDPNRRRASRPRSKLVRN